MVYGNQVAIGRFLTSLAEGFVQTRIEILLLFAFIVFLLLVFSLYLLLQGRAARREIARRSREMLEHRLGELELDDEDSALLGRLSAYLTRGESEYSLLVNSRTFDACAARMRGAEDIPEVSLNSLRLKIGFRITQPEQVPSSTLELPEGSALLLVGRGTPRLRAVLAAQRPAGMLVRLERGSTRPAKGARLTVYFHNAAGIFSFATNVNDVMGDAVQLDHSRQVLRFQRRRYYRRKEHLPVFIKPANAAASPLPSSILDLGGGGASVLNVRGMFREGDLLEISFSPAVGNFSLTARVRRVSWKGKVLNVQFESVSEAERNRIMSFLFAQSQRKGA